MDKSFENESLESLIPGQVRIRSKRRWCSGRNIGLIALLNFFIGITLLTLSITSTRRQATQDSSDPDWSFCGNTSHQAREDGCVFDTLMSAWYHPDCYWPEHYLASKHAANTSFYLDEALTQPFVNDETGNWPQQFLYAPIEYHVAHCTYMWDRLTLAWIEGRPIDSNSWNIHHTRHCIMTINEVPTYRKGTVAQLKQGFPGCGRPSASSS